MWEEMPDTAFDCHMNIIRMCSIAVSINSNAIQAALSNTTCGDTFALPHPTQAIIQNVSHMSCKM